MAFFENLSNKAKTISETSSLNGVIKAEERRISEQYYRLGQIYFEKYGSSPEPEFAEAVSVIKEAQAKISETQEKIENIQNRNKCPNCGNEFKPGSAFCSACGYTLSAAPAAQTQICSKCGNQLSVSAVFCNNCGNRLTQPTTEPVQPAVEPVQPAVEPVQPAVEPVQPVSQPEGKTCPNCGEKFGAEDLFCDNCGTKL